MTAEASGAVWTYWESRTSAPRSAYLDLCLETIRRHSPPLELRVLDRQSAPQWLPDMDLDRWEGLPAPNYRSDYCRSRLLQRHGGVWIDIDTVALAPLSGFVDELDDTGIVCWGKELGRFFGNMCAAAPGSPFVDAWAKGQDDALTRHADWTAMPYSALAQDVCWSLGRTLPWKSLPMGRVAPVPWYQWRRLLSRLESPRRVLAGTPMTVVLWNAVMAPVLRARTHEDLLSSHMLLSRLLRIGLGTSAPADEEDLWTRLSGASALRFSDRGQGIENALRRLGGRGRRGSGP
ncbi:MAG TPA: capsular polysaccharide synthesis protein [Acidimicrobiales bacterium]|nr:capsular polysaccharide synthesis protein [Acidimicrobiales bacterium]